MSGAIVRRLSKGLLLAAISSVLAGTAGHALGADQSSASGPPVQAHDLIGTWQSPQAELKITRTSSGKLHGELYYLGPEASGYTRNGNPISSITIKGRHVRLDMDEWFATLDGDVSPDGRTLTGTSTLSFGKVPLKLERATDKTTTPIDPSPHKVLFVPVDKDVKLEVLDWGGQGPPLVFLAGNGGTGHVYDDFAPKFTGSHHVYAITRRGWGLSSKPEPNGENYDSDRLGDDVLAVIDALKLDRPVVAGHSLAGEELSSIGSRHPEKVRGLVYLDANYGYAFYIPDGDALGPNISVVRRDILELPNAQPEEMKALIGEIQTTLPLLQKELQDQSERLDGLKDPPFPVRRTLRDRISDQVFTGERRYAAIKGPVLAIVATPKPCGTFCSNPQVKAQTAMETAQAAAFQAGVPQAHVIRIANANHFVFRSNEAEVIKEMNAFMDSLH